jgi:ABC-type transport system involved in multi-copper enzyme maturation permease subunit
MITNDARCTYETKSRISMTKAEFNRNETLFASKLDLNLWKKAVKCCIWSIVLYGAATWTFRKSDEKNLKVFKRGTKKG